jgi:hypothetical protein
MLPSVFSRKSSRTTASSPTGVDTDLDAAVGSGAAAFADEPSSPLVRLVNRLSGASAGHAPPEEGPSRRGFLAGMAVAGSALATKPWDFVAKPNTAYASVCGSGATCAEGWSVFCCTINYGQNSCPPGSFLAGWWKADNSSFCGGTARYYLDCNANCPTSCSCYCPTGTCDNRRTCCNQFRYGQCHQEIACAGPVVCRVISCLPPWQLDGACTSSSATDNRTADHTAPCLTTTPPPPVTVAAAPGVGSNFDGRLELFMLDGRATLTHTWQVAPNSGWAGFDTFGGASVGTPAVGSNADGRLEIFALGNDGALKHAWQLRAGSVWSPLVTLPGEQFAFPNGCAIGRNIDGRLEVFAVNTAGTLVHQWQVAPNGTWSGFAALPGTWRGTPAVASNRDGRFELFVVGGDNQLWHAWQIVPNGDWSGWVALGGSWPSLSNPTAILNSVGLIEVFIRDANRQIQGIKQLAPNSGWGVFNHFDFNIWRGSPAVARNADGRLELFAEGDDRQIWHIWQTSPNGPWANWTTLGGTSI